MTDGARIALTSEDRVTIDKIVYRPIESSTGVLLSRIDQPTVIIDFAFGEFGKIMDSERCSIDRQYFGLGAANARLKSNNVSLMTLRPKEQKLIMHRQLWCDMFRRLEAETASLPLKDRITLSDKKMALAIELIEQRLNKIESEKPSRADQIVKEKIEKPRSPRTLRKWLAAYKAAHMDPSALRDQRWRSGNNDPRFHQEVFALMVRFRNEYLVPRGPTLEDMHNALCTEIRAKNEYRKAHQKPNEKLVILVAPSSETFRKFVNSLGAFAIDVGRKGKEYARNKYYISGRGQEVSCIGQIIEVDEWQVHLHLKLIELGIYDAFSAQEKEMIERTRWFLGAAIDVASDNILGMHLSPTPSPRAALRTLEMVMKDKTAYSAAAGCTSTWRQQTGVAIVRTDNGSAYIDAGFRLAVTALGGVTDLTPTGRPQLRARVERLFGTLSKSFVSMFEGRTFSNVVAGEHYHSQTNASLTPADLGRALVRYIVDVHHNSPSSALNGYTPAEVWDRLVEAHGVIPLPSRNQQRFAFGRRAQRSIDDYGVQYANLYFQHEELQKYREKHGNRAKVDIAVDDSDLGFISVCIEGDWIPVANLDDAFIGVSLIDYLPVARSVEQARKQNRPDIEDIVRVARQDLRELAESSAAGANIARQPFTDKQLELALKDLTLSFSTPRDSSPAQKPDVPSDILEQGFPTTKKPTTTQRVSNVVRSDDFGFEDKS